MLTNRVRQFREKLNMTQVALSRKLKIPSQNLSAIELGKLAAWPRIKKKLAKVLKVEERVLFPEEDGHNVE